MGLHGQPLKRLDAAILDVKRVHSAEVLTGAYLELFDCLCQFGLVTSNDSDMGTIFDEKRSESKTQTGAAACDDAMLQSFSYRDIT